MWKNDIMENVRNEVLMQLSLFDEVESTKKSSKTTFLNNMKLPIHRWYRYSAGFSAEWVKSIIEENYKEGLHVYDPFSGSGTVLIACDEMQVESRGVDPHPFVSRMAEAKLAWGTDIKKFSDFAHNVLKQAMSDSNDVLEDYPVLIRKSYSEENLLKLQKLKNALEVLNNGADEYKLTWMALSSILRVSSGVGTAQWQYVLPNKKTIAKDPFKEFENKIDQMVEDMTYFQNNYKAPKSKFFVSDARNATEIENDWADLVITSPPYANNYDYADATRLELSFFKEVESWGELQEKVRKYLIVSNTQHISKLKSQTNEILNDKLLLPIYEELKGVVSLLEKERENHGGKKNYHTMIASYFLDMAKFWIDLRRIVKDGGKVCLVIGDSAPYGVYVPVDKWLGDLALAYGFKSYRFDKERDRNVKWKNRTHTVPLKEGYLWIEG